MEYLKDSEVPVGSHVWAIYKKRLIVAYKKTGWEYYAAGDWDGSFYAADLKIISIIPPPVDLHPYYSEK